MKFYVKFESDSQSAIQKGSHYLGIDFLDQARKAADTPKLDPEKVNDYLLFFQSDPQIEITEEYARESGHFANSYKVTVTVKYNSLNKYASLQARVDRDETTGEVIEVRPFYEIDEIQILNDWFAAACPLEWNPEEA